MQGFLTDEARLQAESLPFLLPHAKKIDHLTKNRIAHRSSCSGSAWLIANEEGGPASRSSAKGISEPKGTS
jgi:hypothetical protein